MLGIRLIPLLVTLVLLPVSSVWATGANSPEALAMALANAYRDGDAVAIVALHHFVPSPDAAVAEQKITARRDWRALLQQFQISGYRLSMLSAKDGQQFRATDFAYPAPVKKLEITLMARHGGVKQMANHYIGRVAGRYFFIHQKSR